MVEEHDPRCPLVSSALVVAPRCKPFKIHSSCRISALWHTLIQSASHQHRYRDCTTMSPIDWTKIHPSNDPQFSHFPSRRSTVFSTKGAVAASQTLAAQCGLSILDKGG